MNYPLDIEKCTDDGEVYYRFSYPDLPGLAIYVDTLDEGIAEMRDAKREWFAAALKQDVEIPLPHNKTKEKL